MQEGNKLKGDIKDPSYRNIRSPAGLKRSGLFHGWTAKSTHDPPGVDWDCVLERVWLYDANHNMVFCDIFPFFSSKDSNFCLNS